MGFTGFHRVRWSSECYFRMYPRLDELGDFLACYFIGFNLQFIVYFLVLGKIILADRMKNKVHQISFEFDCI